MANENNVQQTPKQWLAENLTLVLSDFWDEVSAAFATKQEAGTHYASVAQTRSAMRELT